MEPEKEVTSRTYFLRLRDAADFWSWLYYEYSFMTPIGHDGEQLPWYYRKRGFRVLGLTCETLEPYNGPML